MSYRNDVIFPYRRIIVTGKGQITVDPDLAIIRLGVQTTAEDVTAAQSENAHISQMVLNSLKSLGITDIKTITYRINKLVDFQDGRQIDRGYLVSNIYEIRMKDLTAVGTVIDTAVSNGANVVNSVSFDVENPDLYYQGALNLAVDDAIQKAQSVSSGLNIMFNPVPILITENSTAPMPFQPSFSLREDMATTPVEPGTLHIEASVTAEFIY